LNRARALLFDSRMPHVLWNEAVEAAVYLTNRSPSVATDLKTPYEMRFCMPPKIDHLRLFGCKTYVHLVKEQRTSPSKLAERTRVCYLCGYVGDHIYRVFDPIKVSVVKVRDVVFDETKLYELAENSLEEPPSQPATAGPSYAEWRKSQPSFRKARMDMVLPPGSLLRIADGVELGVPQAEPGRQDVGGSNTTGLDVSQPEPMHTERENSGEPTGVFREASIEEVSIELNRGPSNGDTAEVQDSRRSARTRRVHSYRSVHNRGLISKDILQDLVSVPLEPVTYQEAVTASDHLQWELAMVEEISSLEANRTWDLVDIPEGVEPIMGKWVYKLKQGPFGPSGLIERYKARWVAKGYLQ
jgi:hypothetical protein